jgi:hypothetical protein
VPTKRNRGHIGTNTPSQNAANKAPASNDPGTTGDRGRDIAGRSLGVESGEATRRQREPGVLLAEVVSRRAARKQDGHPACAGEGVDERSVEAVKEDDFIPRSGTLEIKLSKGTLRIFGAVDVTALRAVIECLVG